MKLTRSAPSLLLVLALAACSSAPADNAADGEDVASAAIVAAAPDTSGFVEPNLTPSEADAVVASYGHLDPGHVVDATLLRRAILYYDTNKQLLTNPASMAVVDFSKSSSQFRFYLIDMASGAVVEHEVAHGSGSDPNGTGMATHFSDVDGSHMSSLGFALGSETFSGTHGRSLRLDGLSSTNKHMRSRAILIHGAAYVRDGHTGTGRSWGCFALDMAVKDDVIDAMKGGALLFAGQEE
jgi:L,D-transpeptidase catalytic domain